MKDELKHLFEEKNRRIRRLKRWLRPLPRRTNIHRYPILNWFSKTARKRLYLWSFRSEHAVPALQIGCILTLLPIYGLQLPLAFLFALVARANLPILAGLQLITNPFTVLPIWFTLYQIGRQTLSIVGVQASAFHRESIATLIDNFTSGEWGSNFDTLASVFGITTLGGVIVGTFFGIVLGFVYRIVAKRTQKSYQLLHNQLEQLKKTLLNKESETHDD